MEKINKIDIFVINMEIDKASEKDIPAIISLAKLTWHATYATLVPEGQIEYMLKLFYNDQLLNEQVKDPQHHFLVLYHENELIGYSHCIELEHKIKLSKLYLSPKSQGKGLGKILINKIEEEAKKLAFPMIELYVNRGNPAQYFYEKMGFSIAQEVDVPIGNYFMNDYIMQKNLV